MMSDSNSTHSQTDGAIASLCADHFDEAVRYGKAIWARSDSLRDRLDQQDALSAAVWGLYRAARTWNPESGPFGPWMRRLIRYEIKEAARQATPVSRAAMRKVKDLAAAQRALIEELGREPSANEIAEFLQVDMSDLGEVVHLQNTAREATDIDEIVEADFTEVDADAETAALLTEAMEAFGPLSGDERVILALHYLEDVPFREVARVLGKRPDAVSRMHGRAKERLGVWLEAAINEATA